MCLSDTHKVLLFKFRIFFQEELGGKEEGSNLEQGKGGFLVT